jgi:hypothetical protein
MLSHHPHIGASDCLDGNNSDSLLLVSELLACEYVTVLTVMVLWCCFIHISLEFDFNLIGAKELVIACCY